MDAPVCRTCGQKHWTRLCPGDDVTPDVTKPVTKLVTVTKHVTQTIVDLVAENEALRAEVAMLKRKLAEANKVPMTSAERVRKHRAKPVPAGKPR
jgi:regulator of replication initiation timing